MFINPLYHMHAPSRAPDVPNIAAVAVAAAAVVDTDSKLSPIDTARWDWNHVPRPHPLSPALLRFWIDGIEYRIDYLSLAIVLIILGGIGYVAVLVTSKFNEGVS